MEKNENVKEDFCPVCLAIPLAFASVGAKEAGDENIDKKSKKMYYRIGKGSFILAIILFIYYLYKPCVECFDL